MGIDWYPGHMVTAKKDAAAAMGKNDVVIEVLDARAPFASLNPLFESLRKQTQRPALKVLNLQDLADPARTEEWLAYYNAQPDVRAIAISAKKAGDVARIPKECLALRPNKKQPLNLMILGVPNVGKSTLMNTLLGRPIAKVGNEPAITKQHARHQLKNRMWMTDTPGMTWPGMRQPAAIRLAATGSIGRNAYHEEEPALFLADYLITHYPELLAARYKAQQPFADAHAVLVHIAKVRSYMLRGEPDLSKAASTLLNDFRSGAIGRVSLERVDAVVSD